MYSLVLFIHVIVCLILIALILIQRGKGADMGSSFGAGASATVFGAAGSTSFLVKLTAFFGMVFFIMSLVVGVMSTHLVKTDDSVQAAIKAAEQSQKPSLPTTPQPTE